MANETYQQLWRSLRLYSPVLPVTLAQQFIKNRFRDLRRKRLWSWRCGQNQILTPAVVSSGTANVTHNSATVTGNGTTWTSDVIGRQFRIGTTAPIYTIIAWNSATSLTLNLPFGGVTAGPVGYQIFQAYITPTPTDFQDFISVRDVQMNWRLNLHVPQEYIDTVDAQRAWSGTPYCLADLQYNDTSDPVGSVGSVAQVNGNGAIPVSSGLYTGSTQSVYTIIVNTDGVTGTADYYWRKDNGTTEGPIATFEAATELDEGVYIQWPTGQTYLAGNIFVIAVQPGFRSTMPMYELWPYQMSQRVYPYLYDRRFPDLDDPNGQVPRYIDPDVLVKGALADVFRWPGPDNDNKNPCYSLAVAQSYEQEFQLKVAEMEREDDEVYENMVRYLSSMPFASFAMGADWMQRHDSTY
jgi:hypothetical protein